MASALFGGGHHYKPPPYQPDQREASYRPQYQEPQPLQSARQMQQYQPQPNYPQSSARGLERTQHQQYQDMKASMPYMQATSGRTGGTSSNAWASGTNQNCGNMISDRPTSRVLAPPGGRSSVTFG